MGYDARGTTCKSPKVIEVSSLLQLENEKTKLTAIIKVARCDDSLSPVIKLILEFIKEIKLNFILAQ